VIRDSDNPGGGGWTGATRQSYWHAVASTVTWRKLTASLALALMLGLVRSLDSRMGPDLGSVLATRLMLASFAALILMPAVMCADEAVRRGAASIVVYPASVLLASLVAATAHWHVASWLVPAVSRYMSALLPSRWEQIGLNAVEVAVYGGLATLAYVNRRAANRILETVRQTELRRVQLERRLLEMRLATTQAQVDPRTLLDSLTHIRLGYAGAAPDADERLEELIGRLRAALTRSVGAVDSDGHGS